MTKSYIFFKNIVSIDGFLHNVPTSEKKFELMCYLENQYLAIYFWQNLRNSGYLEFLGIEYFIKTLSDINEDTDLTIKRLVSRYLLEQSDKCPEIIADIFRKSEINDRIISYDFLQLGNKLDGANTKTLVNKSMEVFLRFKNDQILTGPEIIGWLDKLTKENFSDEALQLFEFLTKPYPIHLKVDMSIDVESSFFAHSESLLTSDQCEEMLDKMLQHPFAPENMAVIEIIENNLSNFLSLEYPGDDIRFLVVYDPYNLEDAGMSDELGYILYHKLKDFISSGVARNSRSLIDKVYEYFDRSEILFNRLALWVTNNNFELFKERFLNCFNSMHFLHNYYLTDDLNKIIISNQKFLTASEKDYIIKKYLSININAYPWDAPHLSKHTKEALLFHRLLNPLKDFLRGNELVKFVVYEKQFKEHVQQIDTNKLGLDGKTLSEFKAIIVDSSDADFWKNLFNATELNIDATEQYTEEILQRLFKTPTLILQENFLSLPNYSYYITYQILARTAQNGAGKFFQEDFFLQFLNLAEVISKIDDDSETNTIDINIGNVSRASINLLALIIKNAEIDLSLAHRLLMSEICNTYIEKAYSESDYFDKSGDPLSLVTSITNYTPAKALLLLIEIALYESRIIFRKEKYSFRRCGDKIFEIVGTILSKRGTDRLLHACLGLVLPVLYYLDSRYLSRNLKSIFPKENLELWRCTFSAFLYNTRVSTKLFKLMRPFYCIAISDKSSLHEEVDTTPYFITLRKPLIIHLLNATLERTESIRGRNNLLLKSLANADSAVYAWVSHGIYKYLKGPSVDKFYACSVLYRVWSVISKYEDSIETTSHLETNRGWKLHLLQCLFELKDYASLKKFYRLLKTDISHLTRPFPSRLFFDFLIAKIEEDLKKTVTLLKIFSAELTYGYYFNEDFVSGLIDYLEKAIISEDEKLRTDLESIVDRFGSLGVYDLGPFWEKHFRNQL
jgi:hypothetical protein